MVAGIYAQWMHCAMSGLSREGAFGIFTRFMRRLLQDSDLSFVYVDFTERLDKEDRKIRRVDLPLSVSEKIHIELPSARIIWYIKFVGCEHGYAQRVQGGIDEQCGVRSALIMFCDINGGNRNIQECNSSNLLSILESSIKLASGEPTPTKPPPEAAQPSVVVGLSLGDVYYVFQNFMREKTANSVLDLGAIFKKDGSHPYYLITLTNSHMFKIFVNGYEICSIKLYGCVYEGKDGGRVLQPASIHFLNDSDRNVCTVEGDDQTIRHELGVKVTCNIKHPNPTPEEYIAQLDLIIQACTTHPESHINPEFGEVIQICNEIKSKH
jgi:hypothetical protein